MINNNFKNLKERLNKLYIEKENYKKEYKNDNTKLELFQKKLGDLKNKQIEINNKIRSLQEIYEQYENIIKESENTYKLMVDNSSKLTTCIENQVNDISLNFLS